MYSLSCEIEKGYAAILKIKCFARRRALRLIHGASVDVFQFNRGTGHERTPEIGHGSRNVAPIGLRKRRSGNHKETTHRSDC